MTLTRFATTLVALLAVAPSAAHAAERGTAAEAQAMLKKAVDHYGAAGRQKALSDFSAGKSPFRDRDLYVVCVASDHIIAANGAFPTSVGTSADKLLDAKGVPLGRAFWEAAGKSAEGSIRYPMVNPATSQLEVKTFFYTKVAADLLCGVGAYSVD
jgi:hypothetical protein